MENLLNIFFVDEKTDDSIELTIKEHKVETLQEEIKKIEDEIKSKEHTLKSEKVELEIKYEEHQEEPKQEHQEESKKKEESEEEPKKQTKQEPEEDQIEKQQEHEEKVPEEVEEKQDQEEKDVKNEPEKKDKKKKLKNKLKELKEELKNELRKELLDKKEEQDQEINPENTKEKNLDKQLNLYVFNEYYELLSSLKEMSLLILNDKDKKRQLKKFLIENNINNIIILSSLKDFKKKVTTIPEIKSVIIDGPMFEDNKDNVLKVLNTDGKIMYGIYYSLGEYKTVIKTFSSLEKVKMITNRSTFKRSKFQEITKKLKVSDAEVDLI